MAVEVGSKYQGKVTGITKFGAFVELPDGGTGLVHISEVADNYVKDINEFLKVNDLVTVKVLNVASDGKIGLSIRKAQETKESSSANASAHRVHERSRQRQHGNRVNSFEDKLSYFLKDSEDRLSSLKRQDSKRGGRGGRRS